MNSMISKKYPELVSCNELALECQHTKLKVQRGGAED